MSDEKQDIEKQEKHQAAEYNKFGWCQIHEACYKGFMHAVKRILDNSFDKQSQLECYSRDDQTVTPVVISVLGGHIELVAYLVEMGANLLVRNSRGHGVIEIAAIRQDFRMLVFLINLDNPGLSHYIFPSLVRLISVAEDDAREFTLAAARSLEMLTDRSLYNSIDEGLTEDRWSLNCSKLIAGGIFKVLAKVINDFAKENVISAFVVLINLFEWSGYTGRQDTAVLFFRQTGYVCLINFLDVVRFREKELVCIFGRLLHKIGSCEPDAQAFFRREFADIQESFFIAIINSLRGIDCGHVPPYVDFIDCLIRFNPSMDMPFDLWKHLVSSMLSIGQGCNEKLATSLLRLTCTTISHLPIIQYNFIEQGLANFVSDVLRNDIEALRVIAMESVQNLCLGRIQIQAALFSAHVHDYLFSLLNKYHTKFLKKTTIHAIWAIAGDDVLQRQMVVKKMSLSLINECLSDNDDLNVIGCEALVVMLEQPPNCTQAAHETFLKFESVPRLCRILTTTNQSTPNMLAALRCMKKLCAMCGDNAHRRAQLVVKNSEAMPLLLSFLRTSKSDLIRAESACVLAYLCLENKEHAKHLIDELHFSYNEIFELIDKANSRACRLSLTKAIAIFAYNSSEQEKNIRNCGILECQFFDEILNLKEIENETERCEAAYQTILLAQLIFNKEPSKLIMRGMRLLIGYFEAKATHINLRCFVAEKLVSLSRLKNGIAEALLDINFVDILWQSLSIENEAFRGYVSIALSNLSAIPDGKRKLLKICRQDLSLIELLEFYNNYPESNHRLHHSFMKEWSHVKVYFDKEKLTTRSLICSTSTRT